MNGIRVGTWSLSATGAQAFAYDDSWGRSPNGRPISLSLPIRPSSEPYSGGVVGAFFDNLLPDNPEIRRRIRSRFGARSTDAFDLLAEIGRDCVGALQILPEGAPLPNVRGITARPLDEAGVEKVINDCLGKGFGAPDESEPIRISIAGAQEKTALLLNDGVWCLPEGATPTSHIFKLPIGMAAAGIDLTTSVENEWLCSRIVGELGIPVAPCAIQKFGERTVLVVERFDRRLADDRKYWLRLPQEDFCQATGMSPDQKYERDGGPGIARILQVLDGSENAEADRVDFYRTQIVFWLLAAIDGHAKNFSLFLLPGGAYRLTPRYDILSAHPFKGTGPGRVPHQKIKMAMAVSGKNRHSRWDEIEARHWIETARRVGIPEPRAIMRKIIADLPGVLEKVRGEIAKDFPPDLAKAIFVGTASAAKTLDGQLDGLK